MEIARPEQVIRIATRFINQIKIPLPFNDFNEYLSKPLDIPEDLPQGVSNYLIRYVTNDESGKYYATVTQSFDHVESNYLPFMLDIDTYVHGQFEISDEIWTHLEELRKFKNRIFFGNITEKNC